MLWMSEEALGHPTPHGPLIGRSEQGVEGFSWKSVRLRPTISLALAWKLYLLGLGRDLYSGSD